MNIPSAWDDKNLNGSLFGPKKFGTASEGALRSCPAHVLGCVCATALGVGTFFSMALLSW